MRNSVTGGLGDESWEVEWVLGGGNGYQKWGYAQRFPLKKSPLENEKDLTDEEVVKGIIAQWTALLNQGKHFAFGSTNTFLGYRSEGFDVMDLAVKGPKYPYMVCPNRYLTRKRARIAHHHRG